LFELNCSSCALSEEGARKPPFRFIIVDEDIKTIAPIVWWIVFLQCRSIHKIFLTAKNSFPAQQRRYDAPTYLKEPLEEVGTVPASSFNDIRKAGATEGRNFLVEYFKI